MATPKPQKPSSKFKLSLGYLAMAVGAILLFNLLFPPSQRSDHVSYSEMKQRIRKGEFRHIWLTDEYVIGTPKTEKESKEEEFFGSTKTLSAAKPSNDPDLIKVLD